MLKWITPPLGVTIEPHYVAMYTDLLLLQGRGFNLYELMALKFQSKWIFYVSTICTYMYVNSNLCISCIFIDIPGYAFQLIINDYVINIFTLLYRLYHI